MQKTILFFILTLLIILIVEIYAENSENRMLLYATKPLIIGTLIMTVFYTTKPFESSFGKWIVIGLVFSLIGDSFLMIREIDLFIPGLACFLVAQVIYVKSFYSQKCFKKSFKKKTAITSLFLLYYVAFMTFILPQLSNHKDASLLLPAVIIYGAVICSMGITAALRRSDNKVSYLSILFGALFFIASDTILATNKFILPIESANFWIMSTYTLAQLGIVFGAMFWLRIRIFE